MKYIIHFFFVKKVSHQFLMSVIAQGAIFDGLVNTEIDPESAWVGLVINKRPVGSQNT